MELTCTCEFFSFLKNSLMQINSKLNERNCMITYTKQVSLPKISSIPGAKNKSWPKKWYVADTTWLHVDMKFIFERSTPYLTQSLRSLVRCWAEHEKIKFISTSEHVIFCLYLYKHTVLKWWHFWRFSEDFRRFSKMVLKERWTYPNIFQTKDFQGETDDVSIVQQHI